MSGLAKKTRKAEMAKQPFWQNSQSGQKCQKDQNI